MSSHESSVLSHNVSPFAFLPTRWWQRVLVFGFLLAYVLGTVGYLQLQEQEPHGTSFGNALYHTAQLFLLHTPHFAGAVPLTLEIARWLAALTTLGTVFRAGAHIFRQERAELKLTRLSGHIIVCGLGRKGMDLAAHFRTDKRCGGKREVAVIDRSPEADLVARCDRLGAHVIIGDATQPESLEQAGLARAASLFAVCPDDATNCAIAAHVMKLRASGGKERLLCHVHLSDVDLREALQHSPAQQSDSARVDFRFFDVFDPEARRLVAEGLPLDHDGLPPGDPRTAHLVILGFGNMGRTLALRAAQLGVFANGKRLRISVIDSRADAHRDELLFRHPQIAQVADLQFHQHEAASPITRQLIETCCANKGELTSVAICFDNEALALELALELLPMIEGCGARLAVRMAGEHGLAEILKQIRPNHGQVKRIESFGMMERWCRVASPDGLDSDSFARRIHAEYERLTNPIPEGPPGVSEEERRQQEIERWFRQPEDFRESSRQQAAHIHIKLRAIGCEVVPLNDPRAPVTEFPPDQLEMLARLEHDRWMAERRIANWQFASGKKDIARRTNPNLVDWAQLEHEIQKYDREFVRLIPLLLEGVGLKVCRKER